jgi:3-oxoacyl-[acyl-carrier protein] reductase
MGTLDGKHALVCGSTQGIGRACAEALARQGANVTLMARHAEALQMVCDQLEAGSQQTHRTLQADFSDHEVVARAAEKHVAEHGPVHILINNTGGPAAGLVIDAEAEALAAAFTQHVLSFQMLAQHVAVGMREAGYGRIINIISTSVVQPIRGLGVSNTIRGAVANWGRTLAVELGPFGITVNNLLPGYTDTARLRSLIEGRARRASVPAEQIERGMVETVPAGRFGSPEEIGAVAAFLASPAAAYVNGVNLPVDGGRLAGH